MRSLEVVLLCFGNWRLKTVLPTTTNSQDPSRYNAFCSTCSTTYLVFYFVKISCFKSLIICVPPYLFPHPLMYFLCKRLWVACKHVGWFASPGTLAKAWSHLIKNRHRGWKNCGCVVKAQLWFILVTSSHASFHPPMHNYNYRYLIQPCV